jgi:hypothetical protein
MGISNWFSKIDSRCCAKDLSLWYFYPLETDGIRIHNYFERLFDSDDGVKDLAKLCNGVEDLVETDSRDFGGPKPFNNRVLTWRLKGLLANGFLSDEKNVTLQKMQKDELALTETCDFLNMKGADIKNWNWEAQEDGIAIEPRRQLNGKYRVMMDEDVLEAIFLHYIGIRCSVNVTGMLFNIVQSGRSWQWSMSIPQDELGKRQFYLGESASRRNSSHTFQLERRTVYRNEFCLSTLPTTKH